MSPKGRHQCDQTDHSYVAEAFYWEQRVEGENDAAREWSKNWGSLFARDEPTSHKERISDLKLKMTEEKTKMITSNVTVVVRSLVFAIRSPLLLHS